jgi:hypothetical protein
VRDLPDVLRVTYDIAQAMKAGELGKVYSHGANQGRGNYEFWVQSDEMQTSQHQRTGWRTDETAVREFEPKAEQIFNDVMKDLGGGKASDLLREGTRELLSQILEFMEWYPPEPPQSTYVRTGTLHDSWDMELNL